MKSKSKKKCIGRRRCWFKIADFKKVSDARKAARDEYKIRKKMGQNVYIVRTYLPRKGLVGFYVSSIEHIDVLKKTYTVI